MGLWQFSFVLNHWLKFEIGGFEEIQYRNPAKIYLFQVNNRNTMEICSKLTLKTPETLHWRRSGVFTVNFEIFHTFSSVSIVDFEQVLAGKSTSKEIKRLFYFNLKLTWQFWLIPPQQRTPRFTSLSQIPREVALPLILPWTTHTARSTFRQTKKTLLNRSISDVDNKIINEDKRQEMPKKQKLCQIYLLS